MENSDQLWFTFWLKHMFAEIIEFIDNHDIKKKEPKENKRKIRSEKQKEAWAKVLARNKEKKEQRDKAFIKAKLNVQSEYVNNIDN